jgi:hypothetical protein
MLSEAKDDLVTVFVELNMVSEQEICVWSRCGGCGSEHENVQLGNALEELSIWINPEGDYI